MAFRTINHNEQCERSFLIREERAVDNLPPPPLHLLYMSGIRGELFRALVERKILDSNGKVTPEYANVSLPPLTEEELKLIVDELGKPLDMLIENCKLKISMLGLLQSFVQNLPEYRKDIYIRSIRLIGGYVSYILFSKTNYAKRLFETYKIGDLYNEELFRKAGSGPADIDVRMHLDKRPLQVKRSKKQQGKLQEIVVINHGLVKTDLEQMRDIVIWQLAYWFVQQYKDQKKAPPFSQKIAAIKIFFNSFSDLCTIDKELMQMQLISLKRSFIDWILFYRIPRPCVFTLDDLYLPLEFLFYLNCTNPISPESNRGKPLESFFHYTLGFIDAENIPTIDEKGWLRYLSSVVKGNCSINPPLENLLYQKVNIWKLRHEMATWIEKHHPNDLLASFFLPLNMCIHLQGRQKESVIKGILDPLISTLELKDTLPCLIQNALCKQEIPLETVESVLKIASFYAFFRKSPLPKGIKIELSCFEPFVLQLHINKHVIQFDLEIEKAIKHLQTMQPAWQEILSDLFFHVCPPCDKQLTIEKKCLKDMGIDIQTFTESAFKLVENQTPFLRYVGITTIFSHPTLGPHLKCHYAQKALLSSISFTKEREAMRNEFLHFIGGNIPPINEGNFAEKWVWSLFEYGRNTEKVAFDEWVKLPPSADAFKLIKSLAFKQPHWALRLFMHIKLDNFSEEAAICVLACKEVVSSLTTKKFEHDELIKFMEQKLSSLTIL